MGRLSTTEGTYLPTYLALHGDVEVWGWLPLQRPVQERTLDGAFGQFTGL